MIDEKRHKEVSEYGKQYRGKGLLLKHLEEKALTTRQAIVAKCYECEGYYVDGKVACPILTCPLQPFNPYRVGGVKKKPVSEKAKKAARERLQNRKFTPKT